jgi:hypothetical protein
MVAATLVCALVFAAAHLQTGRLSALSARRRGMWLSCSGGVAVAYVFLELLPALTEHNVVLGEASGARAWLADQIVYLVALAGLVFYYGLELAVRASRRRHRNAIGHDRAGDAVFWVHIAGFCLANLLVGYLLLHREIAGPVSLALYAVALGLHLLGSSYGLVQHHRALYDRQARWWLAGTVLCGWAVGALLALPDTVVSLIAAFLAGSVVMNVMKEELPEDRDSDFGAFVLGVLLYAAIILAS